MLFVNILQEMIRCAFNIKELVLLDDVLGLEFHGIINDCNSVFIRHPYESKCLPRNVFPRHVPPDRHASVHP